MTNPNVKQDQTRNQQDKPSQGTASPSANQRPGQTSANANQSGVKSGSQYDPASKDKKSSY